MGTELALIDGQQLDVIQRTANLLAASGYFSTSQDGKVGMAQVAAKILAGRELGFGPFAAVNGIHIIQGKPAIGANLMASAVKSSGRYDYRVRELTNTVCRIEYFQRAGDKWESIGESSFTADDAKKAGTKNMDKFPKNMLFARAMSNGVRFYCPDIFSGNAVYVPEELGAEVDGDGNVVDATFTVTPTEAPGRAPQHAEAESPTRTRPAPQHASVQATEDSSDNGEVERPWYVVARRNLANGTAQLADKMLDIHRNGNGPCTVPQYQFLSGLIDSLPGVGADGHGKVLSIICQSDISSDNRPSFDLATKLLDYLPTHIKVDGNKIENPNYRADVVEHITKIANALQPALLA